MNPIKLTYADVVKNSSAFLNPVMDPTPLIPKAPRVRLSSEAKTKLREAIKQDRNPELTSHVCVKTEKPSKSTNVKKSSSKRAVVMQPITIATASDWVVPGTIIGDSITASGVNSSFDSVRMLKSEEIGSLDREGAMKNPIEICDDSDEGELNCDEVVSKSDNYSVDGVNEMIDASEFDADTAFADGFEIFDATNKPHEEKTLELDTSLRLNTTDELRRAKRRMEYCFMDDYSMKMKSIKRVDRPEYEGEYTFTVRVVVDDDNTVEVKDVMTLFKFSKVEDECQKSEESYKPESDDDFVSDVDTKRRRCNREALAFDPEKQITLYNSKSLPTNTPVVEINEKASETSQYHWLSKYECVPSNTQFNRFLNKFKNGLFAPKVAVFEGVRYRFLRVGTSSKLSTVKQYNQFVIGNNFTVFRLGMNGSPNVNIGMNSNSREKSFPPPIKKKFTIASLFWANELLKTQKAW